MCLYCDVCVWWYVCEVQWFLWCYVVLLDFLVDWLLLSWYVVCLFYN